MKIAFLFGSMARGGAERVIASLANTYCKWGDDVSIITLDNAPSGYPLDERIEHIHLDVAGKSRNPIEALIRNFKMIHSLRKIMLKNQFDVVVSFALRQAIFLQYAVPCGRKFKIIASERANPLQRKLSRIEQMQYDLFLPKLDGFIFQTERVSHCYPEKVRKIGTVIHNGIFPEILPAEKIAYQDRRHKDICAVGRLSYEKGFDVLLQAFAVFKQTHPEHHLHIYGEGDLRPVIEAQIEQLNLDKSITLHGSVPNVMFKVADMGMFILPSRSEGMPNALMESMACGLPCIAADCDFGPRELLENGQNGLLVPVEDPAALAEAMNQIADNEELAANMSENARDIRNTHDGTIIARKYYDFIMSVIEG